MLSSLSDLPLDEAGRLASHWLLLPEGCVDSPGGLKRVPERLDLRNIGVAAGDLADALQLTDMCPAAVALEQVKKQTPPEGFVIITAATAFVFSS